MDEKKVEGGKPAIDKEYLKKLAEKIKAEKAKKDGGQLDSAPTPPPPPPPRPTSMPKPPAPSAGVPVLGDDEEDEGEGMAAEKTAIIDLASLSGQNADARIIIMDGKDEGKALELTRDEIVAGRSLDNDFVISDISVSRKHFKIVRDTDGFKAEDMGSGNGIRVNGKKETSVVLFDGDLITAGARTIKFEVLNQTLKEKYSRKTIKAAEANEIVVVKSRTPVVAWIAILMVLVVGGGGAYLFYNQQQQQKALQLKLEQEDMLDTIDKLLEEKNFAEAEKLIDEFLFKYQGVKTKEVTKNKELAKKEKVNSANFEQGRKRLAENKPEEAEGFFKLIPDDSLFYPEMVALIGKDKVEAWAIAAIDELIKANKTDEAVRKISALLVEDPANQKANELMASLKAQVGAQKVETIQTTVVKEKEEKKKEQAEREKRKQELISKGKIKAAPKPRPVVVKKPEPKPVVEAKAEYTMDDIQSAVDTYVSKDFDGAIARLELAAGGQDAKVSKKAKDLVEKIKKFKKAYDDKDSKKAVIFDKQISGGKLKDELADLKKDKGGAAKKGGASDDEFASGGDSGNAGGGNFDEAKAKTLYMEAVSLKESDPDKAKEKFKEVLNLVPADNKYYKKAKKALKE